MLARASRLLLLIFALVTCAPVQRRTSITARELEGTKWLLVSYGPAESPIDALEGNLVTVEFDNFEDMHGETGCNFYGKHIEIDGL